MEKTELRTLMRKKRSSLSDKEINEKSKEIEKKLFSLDKFLSAKTVMIYMSAFGEVRTDAIIERLISDKKKVVVPITHTDTETLTLSYINSMDDFTKGAYGIREPSSINECNVSDIDAILVPGIAFDVKGNRIGFGKGYYDKLLSESEAIKIALCYDFQIVQEIDADEHDIPMDMIITEERIISNAF